MKNILNTLLTVIILSISAHNAHASFIEFSDSKGNTNNFSIFSGDKSAEKFFKGGIDDLFPIANKAFIYFYDSAIDGLTFNMIISSNQDNRDDKFFDMDFAFSGVEQALSLVHVNDHNNNNNNEPEVKFKAGSMFDVEGRWKYSTNKDGVSIGGVGDGTSVDFNFLTSNSFLTDIVMIGANGESLSLTTNIDEFNNSNFSAQVVSDSNLVPEPASVSIIMLSAVFMLFSRKLLGQA